MIYDYQSFTTRFLGYLEEQATEQEIMEALETICLVAPDQLQKDCIAFVTLGVPLIIQYIQQHGNPALVCTDLDFCGNSTRRYNMLSVEYRTCVALVASQSIR